MEGSRVHRRLRITVCLMAPQISSLISKIYMYIVYVYLYIHICMYQYIYTYVCINIYTHMYLCVFTKL